MLDCLLDENLFLANLWNSLDSGSVFFKITADPQSLSDSKKTIYDENNVNFQDFFLV